jgi:hypothetical protein
MLSVPLPLTSCCLQTIPDGRPRQATRCWCPSATHRAMLLRLGSGHLSGCAPLAVVMCLLCSTALSAAATLGDVCEVGAGSVSNNRRGQGAVQSKSLPGAMLQALVQWCLRQAQACVPTRDLLARFACCQPLRLDHPQTYSPEHCAAACCCPCLHPRCRTARCACRFSAPGKGPAGNPGRARCCRCCAEMPPHGRAASLPLPSPASGLLALPPAWQLPLNQTTPFQPSCCAPAFLQLQPQPSLCFLQVLVSIQSMILGTEHPFFNEPGYARMEGTPQ